jgi:hypothetical protein
MNPNLKTIPIPPALKHKTKRLAYYRKFVLGQLANLQADMMAECLESVGPDVQAKRQWMLEGANRAIATVKHVHYSGRKWRL